MTDGTCMGWAPLPALSKGGGAATVAEMLIISIRCHLTCRMWSPGAEWGRRTASMEAQSSLGQGVSLSP